MKVNENKYDNDIVLVYLKFNFQFYTYENSIVKLIFLFYEQRKHATSSFMSFGLFLKYAQLSKASK